MPTTSKRAEDVQPGDIIMHREKTRSIVINRDRRPDGSVYLHIAKLGEAPAGRVLDPFLAAKHVTYEVEHPSLTPAQQRADDMVKLLSEMVAIYKQPNDHSTDKGVKLYERFKRADQLLNDLAPKPPTLDEALHALSDVVQQGAVGAAESLLVRAREAGML